MTGQDSLRTVRRAHEGIVLDHVTRNGPLSRQELIGRTGLSRTTLLALVTELLERDVLIEIREEGDQPRRGRPLHRIGLNPRGGLWLAVEVAHARVRVAFANAGQEVIAKGIVPIARNATRATKIRTVTRLLEQVRQDNDVAIGGLRGIALAVVGLPHGGAPAGADQRAADREARALARHLEREYEAPVMVENHTRLAAYAEATSGAAKGLRNVLYIRLSDSVSSGVITGGALMTGAHGLAGEIGHITVEPAGRPCHCGRRGCLDAYLGVASLLTAAREAGVPVERIGEIYDRIDTEPVLRELVSGAVDRLVGVLPALTTLLDPDIVLVGGSLSRLEDLVIAPIRAAVTDNALLGAVEPPPVRSGEIDQYAPVIGGLALMLHNRYDPRRLEGLITRAASTDGLTPVDAPLHA